MLEYRNNTHYTKPKYTIRFSYIYKQTRKSITAKHADQQNKTKKNQTKQNKAKQNKQNRKHNQPTK